jgi:hypothetical protein
MRSAPTVCCNPFPGHGVKVAPMLRRDDPGRGDSGVSSVTQGPRSGFEPTRSRQKRIGDSTLGRSEAATQRCGARRGGKAVCDEATLSPL